MSFLSVVLRFSTFSSFSSFFGSSLASALVLLALFFGFVLLGSVCACGVGRDDFIKDFAQS